MQYKFFILVYDYYILHAKKQHNIFLKLIPYFSFIILSFYLSNHVCPLNGTD